MYHRHFPEEILADVGNINLGLPFNFSAERSDDHIVFLKKELSSFLNIDLSIDFSFPMLNFILCKSAF